MTAAGLLGLEKAALEINAEYEAVFMDWACVNY